MFILGVVQRQGQKQIPASRRMTTKKQQQIQGFFAALRMTR
jgi:hypothetical protein